MTEPRVVRLTMLGLRISTAPSRNRWQQIGMLRLVYIGTYTWTNVTCLEPEVLAVASSATELFLEPQPQDSGL